MSNKLFTNCSFVLFKKNNSLTQPLTYSFIHLRTHSFTFSIIHSITYSVSHSVTHSLFTFFYCAKNFPINFFTDTNFLKLTFKLLVFVATIFQMRISPQRPVIRTNFPTLNIRPLIFQQKIFPLKLNIWNSTFELISVWEFSIPIFWHTTCPLRPTFYTNFFQLRKFWYQYSDQKFFH